VSNTTRLVNYETGIIYVHKKLGDLMRLRLVTIHVQGRKQRGACLW